MLNVQCDNDVYNNVNISLYSILNNMYWIYYFMSDVRLNFIPFPICGIWFYGRYAHEIGIIMFVSHYLSCERATLAEECGPIIRRKPEDPSQDLGNDRDVSIADKPPFEKPVMNSSYHTLCRKTLQQIRKFSIKLTKSWQRKCS